MYKDMSDTKTVIKDKSSNTELYASSQTVALATDTKEGDNPSPHSGYPCVIGCGDKGVSGYKDQYIYPQTNTAKSLTRFYEQLHVDSSRASFGDIPSNHTSKYTIELKGK